MKKILSLAFAAALICASIGCDDKKTTGGSSSGASNASKASMASNASGAPAATTTK
jgi:hypothetical protein